MRSITFKIATVFLVFICLIGLPGCFYNKISNLSRDVTDLKKDFSKMQKERVDEKQVLEERLKILEENLKTSNSRIDDLMRRNPIVGGTVVEEPLPGEEK